jgi:hypothetical protein
MVNVQKSYAESYAESLGKGPAYFRQILASRERIASHLDQLLENGLRRSDPASSEEITLRSFLYQADGTRSLIRALAESNPEYLKQSLKRNRTDLLRFESLSRMDLPLFDVHPNTIHS